MDIVQDRTEIYKLEFYIGLRVSLLIRCCGADDEGITQIDQNISRLVQKATGLLTFTFLL